MRTLILFKIVLAWLCIAPPALFAAEPFNPVILKPGIYVPPPKKKNEQKRVILKFFTPTGLLDANRTLYLATEIPITKQWGIQPEVGYIYNAIQSGTIYNKNKISYDLRLNLRYYWPQSSLIGFYTGPEIFYRRTSFNVGQIICNEWLSDSTSPIGYRCDETTDNIYDLKKNEYGFLIRVGIQPILFKRLALDFSLGLGFKYISNTSSGKKDLLYYPGQPVSNEIPPYEKNQLIQSFPGMVKIGFAF